MVNHWQKINLWIVFYLFLNIIIFLKNIICLFCFWLTNLGDCQLYGWMNELLFWIFLTLSQYCNLSCLKKHKFIYNHILDHNCLIFLGDLFHQVLRHFLLPKFSHQFILRLFQMLLILHLEYLVIFCQTQFEIFHNFS